jgi:signal transduction histidine kinase
VPLLALAAVVQEREQSLEALYASHRQIQDLAGRLITAQEDERAHLARELHDDVSQQLAALAIAYHNITRRLPRRAAEVQDEFARLHQQTLAVSETIRQLSHELHPGVLQHAGLAAALNGHCDEFGRQHAIALTLRTAGDLDGIPPTVALCLYRVAQEALRNVAAHSAAHRAEVALTRARDGLELTITDNGRGFDPAAVARGRGLGLMSIEERVRMVRGSVRIASRLGSGTTLCVQVPLGEPVSALGQQQGTSTATNPD